MPLRLPKIRPGSGDASAVRSFVHHDSVDVGKSDFERILVTIVMILDRADCSPAGCM